MAVMTSVGETGGSGRRVRRTVASSTRTLSFSRWFTTDEAERCSTSPMHYWAWEPYRWPAVLFERERAPVRLGPRGLDSKGYGEPEEEVENKQRGCKSQWKQKLEDISAFPSTFLSKLCVSSRARNSSKRDESRDLEEVSSKKLEREEKSRWIVGGKMSSGWAWSH